MGDSGTTFRSIASSARLIRLGEQRSKRTSLQSRILIIANPEETFRKLPTDPVLSSWYLDLLVSKSEWDALDMNRQPDLVLIHSQLDWEFPLEVLQKLRSTWSCPILWVMPEKKKRSLNGLAKQAYAQGIDDILYSPFSNDELAEVFTVWLKLLRGHESF